MTKKALGRGLSALLSSEGTHEIKTKGLMTIKINDIEPNINQPRKNMDDVKLKELSDSIRYHGIVQPIIVNEDNGVFRIVAGERRWRAARLAGLTEVPVIVKELSEKEIMEVALIENIQREDLNPIEEAEAYERLLHDHNITHEELSNVIGKSRPAISNSLRLLGLTGDVKTMVVFGEITSGHARALLAVENTELQKKIAKYIAERSISVRETEQLIKKQLTGKIKKRLKPLYNEFEEIISDFQNFFGTKVKIVSTNNKRGKILIDYYSRDDLDRILDIVNSGRRRN